MELLLIFFSFFLQYLTKKNPKPNQNRLIIDLYPCSLKEPSVWGAQAASQRWLLEASIFLLCNLHNPKGPQKGESKRKINPFFFSTRYSLLYYLDFCPFICIDLTPECQWVYELTVILSIGLFIHSFIHKTCKTGGLVNWSL